MATEPRHTLLALSIFFLVLVPIFVFLRIRSRHLKGLHIFAEDWLLIAALLLNTGNCINLIIATTLGTLGLHEQFGEHGLPIVTPRRIVAFKAEYITQMLAISVEGLTKMSLLILYRRIFEWRAFRIISGVWLGIVVAWTIAFLFAFAFQCTPVSVFWLTPLSVATPDGGCVAWQQFYLASAVTDVITDAMILALPIPCILRLQMPWRRQLGISLIFMLGAFVLATGSIRTNEFVQTDHNQLSGPPDLSYIFVDPLMWTLIEMSTGIICACLPTFTPLFDASVKGSLAWYMPRSLSLQSLVSRSRSVDISKQSGSDGNDGSRNGSRPPPKRKHTHPWESMLSTGGESTWQTETIPLHERQQSVAEEGEIVVKKDVDIHVEPA